MDNPARPHEPQAPSDAVAAVGFRQNSLPQFVFAGEALVMSAVNAAAEAMFADRPLLGRTLHGALGPLVAEEAEAQVKCVWRTGEPCVLRAQPTQTTLGDGSVQMRYYDVYLAPWRHLDGTVGGVLATALDVSDYYAALSRHRQADAEARETFTGGLTHDLRGPLTAVRLVLERSLRKQALDDAERRRSLRALQALGRADELVENLLDVSRVRAGHPRVAHRATLDLVPSLRAVLQECRATFERPIHFVHDARLTGCFDARLVGRALHNLVRNAVTYGTAGAPVEVRLKRAVGQPHAELSVRNRGVVDAAALEAQLLEPFARGREEPQGSRGWGLGLSVVRAVAHAHDGAIHVRSADDATTFTLHLMLAHAGEKSGRVPKLP